jgi:ABC-type multidrug transport system permease subunit
MNAIVTMAKRYDLTVIASVHQPSPETYSLFDKLLLLGHGKTLYFGERKNALIYFDKLGFACPPYNNPADHFLKLINSDFSYDVTEAEQHITNFSIAFSKSRYIRDINKEIDDSIARTGFYGEVISKKTSKGYARSFLAQTLILMKRSLKNATRNILMFWIRVAMYMCLALLMGSTWWKVGFEQKNIADRFSAYFFSVAFLCFMSVAGIPGFLEERLVFQRERSNGFYSVGPYVLANTLISIPFLMIITVSFSMIAYPMIGFNGNFNNAINFLLFLFLALFVAESMVIFISAVVPIFGAALAITAFSNGFYMVVEGFFVRRDAIPKWLKFGHYSDYQKYAFEAIIKNDLVGLTFNCDPDPSGQSKCRCTFGVNSTETCTFSGQDVLNYYGYTEIDLLQWGVCNFLSFIKVDILKFILY